MSTSFTLILWMDNPWQKTRWWMKIFTKLGWKQASLLLYALGYGFLHKHAKIPHMNEHSKPHKFIVAWFYKICLTSFTLNLRKDNSWQNTRLVNENFPCLGWKQASLLLYALSYASFYINMQKSLVWINIQSLITLLFHSFIKHVLHPSLSICGWIILDKIQGWWMKFFTKLGWK